MQAALLRRYGFPVQENAHRAQDDTLALAKVTAALVSHAGTTSLAGLSERFPGCIIKWPKVPGNTLLCCLLTACPADTSFQKSWGASVIDL